MQFFSQRVEQIGDGEFRLRHSGLNVRKILGRLDAGMSTKQICAELEGVNESDVHACKALATLAMPDRREYIRNERFRPRNGTNGRRSLKVLFDENLSWKIVPELINNITKLSHVVLEDMQSWRDVDIWQRAVAGEWDIIISHDSDFARLARMSAMRRIIEAGSVEAADLSDLPFVVHVDKKNVEKEDVIEAFRKRGHLIAKEAQKAPRTRVYLGMKSNGAFYGPQCREVFNAFAAYDPDSHAKHTTVEAHTINWRGLNHERERAELPPLDPGEIFTP